MHISFSEMKTLQVLAFIALPLHVLGMTSLLVEAGSSKCFFTEAAYKTMLRIDYECPGKCSFYDACPLTGA